MKNQHIKAFWIGFISTVALTAWIYWIWRQKRVVAPKPLVVSRGFSSHSVPDSGSAERYVRRSVVSDPLEDIKGIGPVFANRLNEAGILTFEQLASASPEELARITGVTRWDPADWILQAAAMASAD